MAIATGSILRPGVFSHSNGDSLEVTPAMISELASTYDPEKYRVPLVVGHPKEDVRALGCIRELGVDGDGHLVATIDANEQLTGDLANGRLLAHSVSLYKPEDPNSPDNGKWCLQHLGFLGGNPPAIKGLKRFVFGEKESGATLTLKEAVQFNLHDGSKNDAQRDLQDTTQKNTGGDMDNMAEIDKLKETNRKQNLELTRLKAQIDATERMREDDQARDDAMQFAEQAQKEGRVLPANKDALVNLLIASGKAGLLSELKEFVNKIPQQPNRLAEATDFSEAPARAVTTQEPKAAAVRAYAEKHKVSTSEAYDELANPTEN